MVLNDGTNVVFAHVMIQGAAQHEPRGLGFGRSSSLGLHEWPDVYIRPMTAASKATLPPHSDQPGEPVLVEHFLQAAKYLVG